MSGHHDLRAIAEFRPLLIPGRVSADDLRTLRAWIFGLPEERWSDVDEALHEWQECQLTADEIEQVEKTLGPLRLGATEVVAWVNRSCGARWVNFYPNQFNKFASEWGKGNVGFAEALRASNTELSRSVMQTLIAGDAISKFNFDKCPIGRTVLGDHDCAQSYFDRNWLAADEWEHDKSGAENMNYSSYMFRVGMTDLTRNDTAALRW